MSMNRSDMKTHANKTRKSEEQAVAHADTRQRGSNRPVAQFADNRPGVAHHRKLQKIANNSLQVKHLQNLQEISGNDDRTKYTLQRKAMANGHLDRRRWAGPAPVRAAGGDGVIQRSGNPEFWEHLGYIGKLSEAADLSLHEDHSFEFAERSLQNPRGAAYIVNAILPYSAVGSIPQIVQAMVEGLDVDDYSRIAVILGVNARADSQEELDAALDEANQLIANVPFPVALVRSTFKGKFPYGAMRNEVLHSNETRAMTEYFSLLGLHPYISFQDSDTGSRRVGDNDGVHIFHAVDNVLNDGLEENTEEYEQDYLDADTIVEDIDFKVPIRPLLIAGGYRTGKQEDLERMVEEKFNNQPIEGFFKDDIRGKQKIFRREMKELNRDMEKLNRSEKIERNKEKKERKMQFKRETKKVFDNFTKSKKQRIHGNIKKKLENFPKTINMDMEYRDQYARLDPMLPYAPEPNLFIDATAAYRPSPLTGTLLLFGDGASEFTQLGKALGQYAAEELELIYEQRYEEAAEPSPIETARLWNLKGEFIPTSTKNNTAFPTTKDDIKSQLLIDAQTNRHPAREKSFYTDFQNIAIETDLSRLAYADLEGKSAQGHKGLALATDRFFNSKPDKKGASLSGVKESFMGEIKGRGFADLSQNKTFLEPFVVEGAGKKMSQAMSFPFSQNGPFGGSYFGTQKDQKNPFLFNLAIAQQIEEMKRQFFQERAANRDNFMQNSYPLHGDNPINFRVNHWTADDGECGVHALGYVFKKPSLTRWGLITELRKQQREGAADLRDRTVDAISGNNFNRWLSFQEIYDIGLLFNRNIAVVTFNKQTNTWGNMIGNAATADFVIGGVPTSIGGSVNHWVVLQRKQ